MIPEGLMSGLHFLFLFFIIVISSRAIRSGRYVPRFRELPALNAIDELIGRCEETGRPLLFTLGEGSLSSVQVISGLAIFNKVARQIADIGGDLIVCMGKAEQIPVVEGIVEEAYTLAGKPDEVNYDDLQFIGGSQYSQVAGILAIMEERNPGAFLFPGGTGYFFSSERIWFSICLSNNLYWIFFSEDTGLD